MSERKIIVCGGRDFDATPVQKLWLKETFHELSGDWVVSGGAPGADLLGEEFARHFAIPLMVFTADWREFGNVAGPKRNERMARIANAVIAFPGGRGTADMVRRAKAHCLVVREWQ